MSAPQKVHEILRVAIGVLLIATPWPDNLPAQSDAVAGGAADSAPMRANELRALVAPIALYPDSLLAQVLSAATFPDQIAVANSWLQQNRALSGHGLMQAVNQQTWDDSVKALSQFPSVLDNMAKNLNWTSSLGEAYHNQPSEVMAAVQTLRGQAKAAGNLRSGSQITVIQQSPRTFIIEPTDPQVVYVPQYSPAAIYGTPYVTPGYTGGDVAAASLLGFGAGVAVGPLAGGGCCGWRWGSWNANWNGGAVVYNHNNVYGNPAWHGGYYNGAYHDGYGYHSAYDRAAAAYRGFASRTAEDGNRSIEGARTMPANSWAHADNAFQSSNAFSGFGNRLAGSGWQSRAESLRGWSSMRAGGFLGGRFGGGHFGGGVFRGGFRR
jgi:hypothetical protein